MIANQDDPAKKKEVVDAHVKESAKKTHDLAAASMDAHSKEYIANKKAIKDDFLSRKTEFEKVIKSK